VEQHDKIYIAGHRGMVGSALQRKLESLGYDNLVMRSSRELDLSRQKAVEAFFAEEQPAFVFLAAAKVGGILANSTYRGSFIYENLMIEANVIEAARKYGVRKLMFLGSSCIYPKMAPQPMKEEYLLTGPLEETNKSYALAKISGIELCDAYRMQYGCDFFSVMPTNLYGPNDNYDLANSHVLPALIRKFHEAKRDGLSEVVIWGTGEPKREFMHADDLADACVFLMENYSAPGIINIGVGEDMSILTLAELIQSVVGFEGKIVHDYSKPDGTPRKLLDVSKLHGLGWQAKIPLAVGIAEVYKRYKLEDW
jgi:GDP-L-fucose synthase